MRKKGIILLAAFAVLAVIGTIAWAILSVPEAPRGDEPVHVMRYEGNSLSVEKDGRTIWKMTAESLAANADNNTAEATNIDGTFYQPDGRELNLKAPHAVYRMDTKDLSMDGGIKVQTTDGIELTSRELAWSDAKSTLTAIGDAKLTKEVDAVLVTAESIESSDGFQKLAARGKDGKKAHIQKGSAAK